MKKKQLDKELINFSCNEDARWKLYIPLSSPYDFWNEALKCKL